MSHWCSTNPCWSTLDPPLSKVILIWKHKGIVLKLNCVETLRHKNRTYVNSKCLYWTMACQRSSFCWFSISKITCEASGTHVANEKPQYYTLYYFTRCYVNSKLFPSNQKYDCGTFKPDHIRFRHILFLSMNFSNKSAWCIAEWGIHKN